MTDATGHMDRPGAGPFSTNEFVDGIPTNHYTHETRRPGESKSSERMLPAFLISVVKEFDDRGAARLWIREEFLAGRLCSFAGEKPGTDGTYPEYFPRK